MCGNYIHVCMTGEERTTMVSGGRRGCAVKNQ